MGHGTDSEDDEPNEQQQLPPPDTAPPVPPPTADEARERARELDRAAALPFREKRACRVEQVSRRRRGCHDVGCSVGTNVAAAATWALRGDAAAGNRDGGAA